jgi:uncharacterized repeat protein (TIGR03803 family)
MLRRTLLKGALASIPLAFMWRPRLARANGAGGYGPLVDDPDSIFDLPEGFTYKVVSRKGDIMSDGYRTPGNFDGMGCFPGAAGTGTIVLMRNHELGPADGALGPVMSGQSQPAERYASGMFGGVTRVVLDAETLEVQSSNLVLYGTTLNCSGGKSPWGWLTCEENMEFGNHGYVYACSTTAERVQPAVRVDAYGRFQHEAAVVDPETYVVYMTEDQADSCFYRFVPTSKQTPWEGKLQALRIVGQTAMNMGTGKSIDDSWEIAWIDIDDPTPAYDTVRATARADGAAVFMRGEGCAMHDGAVFFTATTGGPLGTGQVFRLDPDGDGGTLTLLAQSEDQNVLDKADTITVAPWGQVFTAEDGTGEQCIRAIDMDGTVTKFGRNAYSGGELTGICFSPDGKVMFVNIFGAGLTIAITGPFPEMPQPTPPPPHGRGDAPMPGHETISGDDGDLDGDGTGADGAGDKVTVGGCSAAGGNGGVAAVGGAAILAGAVARSVQRRERPDVGQD